jgi:hypothetical protein
LVRFLYILKVMQKLLHMLLEHIQYLNQTKANRVAGGL